MRGAANRPPWRRSWRWLLSFIGLSVVAFSFGLAAADAAPSVCLLIIVVVVGLALFTGLALERSAARPLSTAASLLDALRHGDYTHRARVDTVPEAARALLFEINELASHLEHERIQRQETQALLNALIENVDIALLAFDSQARLLWWNPAAQSLFRSKLKTLAAAQSLGCETFLRGESARSVTLDGQAAPMAFELRRGVFHQGGQRYQFVLLSSAQRVRREEERAAWQRLVRVLGHEVNNTLTPVQSLAGTCLALLADEPALSSPELLRALETIEQRAHSLSRFIADYARLARLPEPELVPVALPVQLARVAALDTRCTVQLRGHAPAEIMADPVLLDQALTNLLRNAVDASVETQGSVTVDWELVGAEVVISILDEGRGITNPDNLFVPLFSTKKGGSGVGLVLARNIVEAHGGHLSLKNRVRQPGCVARVTLPRLP
jgi:two-component system, NtrC family, nitrogen regulation sensor histidine kinase NtrY